MKYDFFPTPALMTAALLVATPIFAQDAEKKTDVTADTVVATVNDAKITLGHVLAARQSLPPQYQGLADDQLFEGIVTQMVQQELLKQSAGDLDMGLKLQLENEERVIVAGSVLEGIAEAAVSEDVLKAAYDAKFADFEPSREYRAAHILVESEDEAKEIIKLLDEGADFADLAKEKSTGPSGPNGGDLGWFGKGMMVAPFEEAVVMLEEGKVSEPVETQFGWHVIKLFETRFAEVPSLEDVQDELSAEIQDEAIRKTIEELEAKGKVEMVEGIEPSVIRLDAVLEQ